MELGTHIAATLAALERVAVVLAGPRDTVAADIAREKGLPIRTCATLGEANDWLVDATWRLPDRQPER